MTEDVAFSDWSDRLDAGTSHWLPAYGFQQPSQLQESLLQQDYLNHDGGSQQGYQMLETIPEETSDDLRSESDYSGAASGWPDSDVDSVILRSEPLGRCCIGADWSGSERDIAVPKKRRRRQLNNDPGVHDDDDDDDDDMEELVQPSVSSRSSSLLQFETLEKHCETIFRTSASAEPFPQSPSIGSSFSFDSLENSRGRFYSSVDSLNEKSSLTSSCLETSSDVCTSDEEDEGGRCFSGNKSSLRNGLRSHRSFDSLVSSCHEQGIGACTSGPPLLNGEFSQSLNDTSLPHEDLETEVPAPSCRGLYKTMECLHEAGGFERSVTNRNKLEQADKRSTRRDSGEVGAKRSAENLSEDSGFGEHIPKGSGGPINGRSGSGVFTIEEKRDDDRTSDSSYGSDISGNGVKIPGEPSSDGADGPTKFSGQSWQSAPDLGGRQSPPDPHTDSTSTSTLRDDFGGSRLPTSTTSLLSFTIKDEDEILIVPENKSFVGIRRGRKMASRTAVSSTPNLFTADFLEKEKGAADFGEPRLLARSVSFKHSQEGKLRKTSSRGSNIQITTSFVNLSSTNSGSNKGVHFCPVVSEVSWQDSDDEGQGRVSPGREKRGEEEDEGVWVVPQRYKAESTVEDGGEKQEGVVVVAKLEVPVRVERPSAMEETVKRQPHKSKGIGGFFQRFSLRRLSGRDKKRKDKKKEAAGCTAAVPSGSAVDNKESAPEDDKVQIIPLHPPEDEEAVSAVVSGKPPLPPPGVGGRRRCDSGPASGAAEPPASAMSSRTRQPPPPPPPPPTTTNVLGLLETDIDSPDNVTAPAHHTSNTTVSAHQPAPQTNKKARSLLDLGETHLTPCPPQDHQPHQDNRAKSMEFLLDKDNQHAAQPPENELQKVGGGGGGGGESGRVMSEHQLRVQRSLQKLNIPDWYKNSQLPAQGFLLKRNSTGGAADSTAHWPGLSSKTTSLSSLGSAHSATPRSPTSNLLSPSPTPSVHTFSRWSTSRLNSGGTSTSTSPCGSARSSFNYRQPYLGWRSQEKIARPRTPAERLAAGLLPQKPVQQHVPNLSEVHTSIKEVTSAIANYVSEAKGGEDRLSPGPRWDNASSRSASPRGSTGRLCWLESSFVGSRPIDVPETPVTLTATDHNRNTDLYLDLTPTNRPKPVAVNDS